MNFCGIICEFNPFHNGHKYLIDRAKEITNLDIICLMSGNFVQRGEPAIENKYERAKKAILNGASTVVELPTIFACSNAENFAMGAVKILGALGASHLAFGVEQTDLPTLDKIAELKVQNSEEFKNSFKNETQNGINFNTALKRAIAKLLGNDTLEVLNKPNNILAIEYLTAIKKLKLNILPVAINRCDNGFLSQKTSQQFLSAHAIRERIYSGESVDQFIPKNAKLVSFFEKNGQNYLNLLKFYKIMNTPESKLGDFYDYSEGIEYRIKKLISTNEPFNKVVDNISTPRYRKPRINKLLLYPLLGVTSTVVSAAKKSVPIAKLLAINKNKKEFLKSIDNKKIRLIIKNHDYENLTKSQKDVINIDLNASNIYSLVTCAPLNLDKKIGTLFL